jgi:hypothetical protein
MATERELQAARRLVRQCEQTMTRLSELLEALRARGDNTEYVEWLIRANMEMLDAARKNLDLAQADLHVH